jgi:hypothetical protein
MGTRYRGVPFVEMVDIDIMARFSVSYVNIFGAGGSATSSLNTGEEARTICV